MEPSGNLVQERLITLLASEDARWRMLALHMLSEGYADSPQILAHVIAGWEKWTPENAFPEFPMISHLAIEAERIEECCQVAQRLVQGNKLIHPATRCAGKLIEQLVQLPPRDLEPHEALLESTKRQSKIFFRVDLEQLRDRIQLAACTADQCAAVLNNSVELLCQDGQNPQAFHQGVWALEALRMHHPNYIDLGAVLKTSSQATGPAGASLRLTLVSLSEHRHAGVDSLVGEHLLSEEESVYCTAVDALVRSGSRHAAEALLEKLELAEGENSKWIVRGLQRLQLPGLASGIAACRDQARDPYIWLMLLIAEIRQCQEESIDRIAFDLNRLQSPSEPLLDALAIYLALHRDSPNIGLFRSVVEDYVTRVGLKADLLE